jgi:hypothetical protein
MYGGDFHEDEMAGNVGNIYKKGNISVIERKIAAGCVI